MTLKLLKPHSFKDINEPGDSELLPASKESGNLGFKPFEMVKA